MLRLAQALVLSICAASLAAQAPTLVNAAGQPFPILTVPVNPLAQAPNSQIYASLHPSSPTGWYVYDIADAANLALRLSLLPEYDRIFHATNNGSGVFTITRLNNAPSLPALGDGVGGFGDSMPVFPFTAPLPSTTNPELRCIVKVLIWSIDGTPNGPTLPPVYGPLVFHQVRVGDSSGGSISGVLFEDANQNQVRDLGEPGLANATVNLVSNGNPIASSVTGANGAYLFSSVPLGDYQVQLAITPPSGQPTTPTLVAVSACGCGNQVVDFGWFTTTSQQSVGRTIGFWRNNHGVQIIVGGIFWDELVALNLVNASGAPFDPSGNVPEWRTWLQQASSVNMAYMLSAQLAAMQLNVLSGSVSAQAFVMTANGPMQISALIAAANAAILADPYTPSGDPNRAAQQVLKNALDAANNNLNWL